MGLRRRETEMRKRGRCCTACASRNEYRAVTSHDCDAGNYSISFLVLTKGSRVRVCVKNRTKKREWCERKVGSVVMRWGGRGGRHW